MPDNPLNPRMLRGAIIAINLPNPLPRVIAFQYNPETLTRTLEAQMAGDENSDRAEALRLKGAPVETIKVDIEIDAADQLEAGDPVDDRDHSAGCALHPLHLGSQTHPARPGDRVFDH
jgi:hypothetical protein